MEGERMSVTNKRAAELQKLARDGAAYIINDDLE